MWVDNLLNVFQSISNQTVMLNCVGNVDVYIIIY